MTELNLESMWGKSSDPTLRDLLAPLFRRRRTLAYTFCGIMLGTVVAAFILNNTHKATMEILVNEQRLDPSITPQSTQGQASAPAVTDYDIGSEIELLKSPDLLEQVVTANNLQQRERGSFTTALFHRGADDAWFSARAVEHLKGKLNISAVSKSNLIAVDYKASDPKLAYNVLQTLGKLYLAKHLEAHRRS